MAASNLDIKYSQLVDQLQALNDKFDQFINGDATVTISTGSGTIKSLAGIIQDITTIQYIQKMKDHRLYSQMIADASILEGMLIRLWGDGDLNGIYIYQDGAFNKINYQTLYGLAP